MADEAVDFLTGGLGGGSFSLGGIGDTLGGVWDSITGSSSADAIKDAMELQLIAQREAREALSEGYGEASGFIEPYVGMNLGGWKSYEDAVLGRRLADDPVMNQLADERMEEVNRQSAYTGGLGGGQRLKRLQQADAQNQMAQRQMRLGEFQTLGRAQSPNATNLAQMRMNAAGSDANLITQGGNVQASGLINAQNAKDQGLGNIIGLGMMGAGALAGSPMMAMGGASQMGGSVPAYTNQGMGYLPEKPNLFAPQNNQFTLG